MEYLYSAEYVVLVLLPLLTSAKEVKTDPNIIYVCALPHQQLSTITSAPTITINNHNHNQQSQSTITNKVSEGLFGLRRSPHSLRCKPGIDVEKNTCRWNTALFVDYSVRKYQRDDTTKH